MKENLLLANFISKYAAFINLKVNDFRTLGFDIGHVLSRHPV